MAQEAAQGVTGRGFGRPGEVPGWVGFALLPLLNLLAALVLSGLVILVIGENPLDVLALLVTEAVGYPEAIGYTLYYTTSYIFTGLAVAVAFHCGLFNIGGEGQAYIGGLGAGRVGLAMTSWPWRRWGSNGSTASRLWSAVTALKIQSASASPAIS